jgi:hypothetical protein
LTRTGSLAKSKEDMMLIKSCKLASGRQPQSKIIETKYLRWKAGSTPDLSGWKA